MSSIWADARRGRIMLCLADDNKLEGLVRAPLGRVEKQNTDRTPSGKGRLIWGGRAPNARCAKEDPPGTAAEALQPVQGGPLVAAAFPGHPGPDGKAGCGG